MHIDKVESKMKVRTTGSDPFKPLVFGEVLTVVHLLKTCPNPYVFLKRQDGNVVPQFPDMFEPLL